MDYCVKFVIFSSLLAAVWGCVDSISFKEATNVRQLSSIAGPCNDLNAKECLNLKTENYEIGVGDFKPIDIVFIFDVSLSMQANINKVSSAFSQLMLYIKNFDWQIALTTADHGDHVYTCEQGGVISQFDENGRIKKHCPSGKKVFSQGSRDYKSYKGSEAKFGRFMPLQMGQSILVDQTTLTPQTKNYSRIFSDTLTRKEYEVDPCLWPPFCQGAHEQPLRVLKSVISQGTSTHSDFFRDEAVLAAFVITEEKERAEDPENSTTPSEVLKEFSKTFKNTSEKKLIVYGVSIVHPKCLKDQNAKNSKNSYYSKKLEHLVHLTEGSQVNICDEDYSPSFSKISKQLRKYVNKIPLQFHPVVTPDTPIEITIRDLDRNVISVPWEADIENKSISFSKVLETGSLVEIKYYYDNHQGLID